MDADTYSNKKVIKNSNANFINVKLNATRDHELFSHDFGGNGVPATYWVDGEGEILRSSVGYVEPDKYLKILRQMDRGYGVFLKAKAAMKESPRAVRSTYLMADALGLLGSRRKSIDLFHKLIEKGNSQEELKGELRKYYALSHAKLSRSHANQEPEEAWNHAFEYRKLDSKNEYGALDNVVASEGMIHIKKKEFEKCVDLMTRARKTWPDSDEGDLMLFLLGKAQFRIGLKKTSLETLESLLKQHPDSEWVEDARYAIKVIRRLLKKDE